MLALFAAEVVWTALVLEEEEVVVEVEVEVEVVVGSLLVLEALGLAGMEEVVVAVVMMLGRVAVVDDFRLSWVRSLAVLGGVQWAKACDGCAEQPWREKNKLLQG